MAITASDVKNLREMTGAGMMACKNALKESNGDLEAAVDYLRKKGLAAAQKKQSRVAAEGAVGTAVEGNYGVVVEVNCETDFVSKGDDFQGFVKSVTAHIVKNKPENKEALLSQTLECSGKTITETITELTLKCGEKLDIRRFESLTLEGNAAVGSYNHGGKIGVLVGLEGVSGNDSKAAELLKDLGMHVAAASPSFLNASDIDESFKEREAAIYADQLKEQGKPEKMIPNIVQGKLKKLASEVCLLEQKFVKDPDLTIKQLLDKVGKELGATLSVTGFKKVNLGEGIEKKEDNLADEVAKMTAKQ